MVRPTIARLEGLWASHRPWFDEHPVEVFKHNIKVHVFREPDPVGLIREVGVDVCVFGSDFPHPEGQADPLDFTDRLEGLSPDEKAKIMGGNLERMLDVSHATPAA